MSLIPGSRLGTYQIVAALGAGGMGEVYRATDTRLGRDVAVKILPPGVADDPERLARFEREARTIARLNHPNIVVIYGIEQIDRTWALGMIDRSIGKLQKEYEKSGRGALFAALAPLVWRDGSAETLAAPAARLEMTTHAFTVALHRLRQRFGQRLRADVAETVADETEVDEELRHLIAAVSNRPAAS